MRLRTAGRARHVSEELGDERNASWALEIAAEAAAPATTPRRVSSARSRRRCARPAPRRCRRGDGSVEPTRWPARPSDRARLAPSTQHSQTTPTGRRRRAPSREAVSVPAGSAAPRGARSPSLRMRARGRVVLRGRADRALCSSPPRLVARLQQLPEPGRVPEGIIRRVVVEDHCYLGNLLGEFAHRTEQFA